MRGFEIKTCVRMTLLFICCASSIRAQSTTAATPTQAPKTCVTDCECTPWVPNTPIIIDCSGREFTAVPANELQELAQNHVTVSQIDLSYNNITHIRATDFSSIGSTLRTIDLRWNQILSIEDEAFVRTNVGTLQLGYNKLKNLPLNVFAGLTLSTLDLRHNQLRSMPRALGETLTIGALHLNSNSIKELANDSFDGIEGLTTLDLSDCGLTAFESCHYSDRAFYSINTLYLDQNNFNVIKASFFYCHLTLLNTLSLRLSGIRSIERKSFINLNQLQRLYLAGNNLGIFKGQVFKGLHLSELDLSHCNITDLKRVLFKEVRVTNTLYLNHNNIDVVHHKDFKFLKEILVIDLSFSNVQFIQGTPFENLTHLGRLVLSDNHLGDDSLSGLGNYGYFYYLDLTNNSFTRVPNLNQTAFPYMRELLIGNNNIRSIATSHLQNMNHLHELVLNKNEIEFIEEDAFEGITSVTNLDLDNMHLTHLPRMPLPELYDLHIRFGELEALPDDLCEVSTKLVILEAGNNSLQALPSFSGCQLSTLGLANNRIHLNNDTLVGLYGLKLLELNNNGIESLPDGIFRDLRNIQHLFLRGNQLTTLPADAFAPMPFLIDIDLAENQLTELEDGLFHNQGRHLKVLDLERNSLKHFSHNVLPVNSTLGRFNLSDNDLTRLEFPNGGLVDLVDFDLQHNFDLLEVPGVSGSPNLTNVWYTYSYHCCIWREYKRNTITVDHSLDNAIPTIVPTAEPQYLDSTCVNGEHTPEAIDRFLAIAENFQINVTFLPGCKVQVTHNEVDLGTNQEGSFDYLNHRTLERPDTMHRRTVRCNPQPNELTPCNNLMDPWALRVLVWAVWVLALLGNGTVLFVAIAAKEKLEVYQFLICCLAFADFCMGVYLAFLAAVDIRTFGEISFYQSALHWQKGPGCKAAGFIAVFASELSVFILVVLTLERVHTIAYTFNRNEKVKMRVAIVAAVVSALLAAVLAALPLSETINSYSEVAVCLPYLTENWEDKMYIGCLLTINLIAFLIILFSYVYIFRNICKSPAAHQKKRDITIAAAKIAVLIVTAFFCWVPIAIIGYLALAGVQTVDTTQAKFLIVLVYPLNACLNPFIYAIFTRQFRQKMSVMFKRSSDRVNSLPPRRILLKRGSSAFLPDNVRGSPRGNPSPTELMNMRQSRRSNSLSVHLVTHSNQMPPVQSPPTLTPPPGVYMGRRASLPAAFGSTLRTPLSGPGNSQHGSSSSSNSPSGLDALPFNLAPNFGENNSQPNLREADHVILTPNNLDSSLGGSQDSANRHLPDIPEEQEDGMSVCSSDSDDYSDAQEVVLEEKGPESIHCVEMDSKLSASTSVCSLPLAGESGHMNRTKCKVSSDSACSGCNSIALNQSSPPTSSQAAASPAHSCSLSRGSFSSYDLAVSDYDRETVSPAPPTSARTCGCGRGATPAPCNGLSDSMRHQQDGSSVHSDAQASPDSRPDSHSRLKATRVPIKLASPHRTTDASSHSQISIRSETSV